MNKIELLELLESLAFHKGNINKYINKRKADENKKVFKYIKCASSNLKGTGGCIS
jgi:hypothetical protein